MMQVPFQHKSEILKILSLHSFKVFVSMHLMIDNQKKLSVYS